MSLARRPWTAVVPAATLVVAAGGCRSEGITAARIEGAFAPTFANLVRVQLAAMGMPTAEPSALRASAKCHKIGVGRETRGPGSWVCTVLWFAPGSRTALRDTYDLTVRTDGCYTAQADGAEAHMGGPTLTTAEGNVVVNQLYAFDGCFDTI